MPPVRSLSSVLLCALAVASLGCSKSPEVKLTTTDHPEFPRPESLAELLPGRLHRAFLDCYRDSKSTVTGTSTVNVQGSHGLLDVTVTSSSGDQGLDSCTTGTITGGRMAREIGDTDHFIGFGLSVEYLQE